MRLRDLMLFGCGVAGAAVSMMAMPEAAMGRGVETLSVARSLVAGRGFADPFDALTGPTAHLAPLYPLWLALLMKLFGMGQGFVWAAVAASMAAHGVVVALMPRVSERAGLWAAGLLCVLPLMAVQPQWEGGFAAAGAAGLFALKWEDWRHGVYCGLLLLLQPACVLLVAAWAVMRRPRWVWAAAVVAVVGPWMVRNWVVVGSGGFVRNNLGAELRVSHNEVARVGLLENGESLRRHHPMGRAEEVARMGEAAFERRAMAEAVGEMTTHAGRTARLTAERFWEFWFPGARRGWFVALSWWGVTLVSFVGMRRLGWLAVALVAWSMVYALVQAEIRYRAPVMWVTALGAGEAVAGWRRVRRGGEGV